MKHWLPEEYRRKAITAIIVIAAGIGIFLVAQRLGAIFGFFKTLLSAMRPVLIGIGIAYLLSPVLRRAEKILRKIFCRKKDHPKLVRSLGVAVCYVLFLSLVGLFLGIVLPQVYESLRSLFTLLVRFIRQNTGKLNDLLTYAGLATVDGDELIIAWEEIINQTMGYVTALFDNALAITTGAFNLVLNLLVALAVSIYSLFEKERFGAQMKKVVYGFFSKDACAAMIYWMRRTNLVFSGFISGKIYDSIIMGLLCYVCMRIFKMPYAELVSCVFGVTNIVPFFGPIVGGVIGTLVVLIVDPTMAIWFAVLALVLQQLDGNLIGPHILGETIGLSAFWIMLAILVGGGLFGFPGMLLGAPVFAIFYALCKAFISFRLNRKGLPTESSSYYGAPESLEEKEK